MEGGEGCVRTYSKLLRMSNLDVIWNDLYMNNLISVNNEKISKFRNGWCYNDYGHSGHWCGVSGEAYSSISIRDDVL
jgi:hypothetical protein